MARFPNASRAVSPVFGAIIALIALTTTLAIDTNRAKAAADDGTTLRFYQAASAYIVNPDGGAFDVAVDVRQWHLLENGPRELLVKLSDPDGKIITRELVEDDGVKGDAYLPEAGGWDHEMWYYTLLRSRGSMPMFRWSALTDPARMKPLPVRTVKVTVPAGKKGIYRLLLAGSRDHVATVRVAPNLKIGWVGHPLWLHGHHGLFAKSFVYVPRGTTALDLGFAEFDQPVTRQFKVSAPDGAVLWDGPATGGFQRRVIALAPAGKYDDQLLTVETSAGAGDFMLHVQLTRVDQAVGRGGGVPAIFCPDAETAKVIQGGAIYHDGLVLFHPFQVRLHEWIKANIKPDDLIVRDAKGNEIKPTEGKTFGWNSKVMEYKGLAEAPGFVPLNGPHEPPPLCDQLMHNYTAHKNRNILCVSIVDLEKGLRVLTVGDTTRIHSWGGNLGYIFGTYAWHYWRPSWRILQQTDAPPELKAIVREAMIQCGDRIAMAAGIERVNGNAFSHVVLALRYAKEGTQDPLLSRMADTYLDRFASGSEGWGRGTGISKSGDSQEHFGHDFHYGSYIYDNFTAVVNDLNDPKFKALLDRIAELYTYLYCPEDTAYPWGARTSQQAGLGATGWKGKPGPDFTVSVNGGDEWFAARRPTYYALTFHGRLCPEWLNNYFATRLGYGGGTLCQLTVPGKGVVLTSTLNGSYGTNMERVKWPDFHLHSIVGTMADGQPLVAADSEHLNAKLNGSTVTGSGEVRDRPLHATRSYTFNADTIACAVSLADTDYRAALWNQGPSSNVAEAWEMIPFLPGDAAKLTTVRAQGADGKAVDLGKDLITASSIVIDRGGYGVKIELDQPRPVKRGNKNTVLVQLADKSVAPDKIQIKYTLRPFTAAP